MGGSHEFNWQSQLKAVSPTIGYYTLHIGGLTHNDCEIKQYFQLSKMPGFKTLYLYIRLNIVMERFGLGTG